MRLKKTIHLANAIEECSTTPRVRVHALTSVCIRDSSQNSISRSKNCCHFFVCVFAYPGRAEYGLSAGTKLARKDFQCNVSHIIAALGSNYPLLKTHDMKPIYWSFGLYYEIMRRAPCKNQQRVTVYRTSPKCMVRRKCFV